MTMFKKETFKKSPSSTNNPIPNNARADTLSLNEAAHFLRIHKETLRQKAASGEIPGSKIGRSWVFIKQDLVNHVRSLYAGAASQGVIIRRKQKLHYTNMETYGGSTLLTENKEYNKLLGLVVE